MGDQPLLEVCPLQEPGDLEGCDRNAVGRVTSLGHGQEHFSAVHQTLRPEMHGDEELSVRVFERSVGNDLEWR